MINKAITVGVIATLMSASTFATPHQCLRNGLRDILKVPATITGKAKGIHDVKVNKYPNWSFTDSRKVMYYTYYFNNKVRNQDESEAISKVAADCGCNVAMYNKSFGESSVDGWCWDV